MWGTNGFAEELHEGGSIVKNPSRTISPISTLWYDRSMFEQVQLQMVREYIYIWGDFRPMFRARHTQT
jgi:hypothetical protein